MDIIGENCRSLPRKLSFPTWETVVSCLGNYRFLLGKLSFPAWETVVSCLGNCRFLLGKLILNALFVYYRSLVYRRKV